MSEGNLSLLAELCSHFHFQQQATTVFHVETSRKIIMKSQHIYFFYRMLLSFVFTSAGIFSFFFSYFHAFLIAKQVVFYS